LCAPVKKKPGFWHFSLVHVDVTSIPSVPDQDGTPVMTPCHKKSVKGLLVVKHHAIVGDSGMFYLMFFDP
jgi:hypothetical protein